MTKYVFSRVLIEKKAQRFKFYGNFPPKDKDAKNFEHRLNPVMLVLIG